MRSLPCTSMGSSPDAGGLNDDGENSFTTVFSADNWIVPEIRSLTFHRLFGKGKQTIFLGQFLVGVFFWKRLGLNFALV